MSYQQAMESEDYESAIAQALTGQFVQIDQLPQTAPSQPKTQTIELRRLR